MKPKRFKVGLLLMNLLIAMVVLPILAPLLGFTWSPINCSYQDIDLNTGRVKYTRMIYWIPVRTAINPTEISEALAFDDLESRGGEWRRVNTFSPGVRHSPHHTFHSAIYQTKLLALVWEDAGFDAHERKSSAREVLRLWKEADDDSSVDDYLKQLYEDEVG